MPDTEKDKKVLKENLDTLTLYLESLDESHPRYEKERKAAEKGIRYLERRLAGESANEILDGEVND